MRNGFSTATKLLFLTAPYKYFYGKVTEFDIAVIPLQYTDKYD